MEEDIKKIEYFLNQADEYYDGNINIKDCVITKEVAEAIENLIARNRTLEKEIKLMKSVNLDENYIPKSKVREMKDKLLKEYKCAEEGFMKKQIPTSVVDGTIVQELGWILQEIDKLLQKGDNNETKM